MAGQIADHAQVWQAVLCGVRIATEFGEGAGRWLADLVQEQEVVA